MRLSVRYDPYSPTAQEDYNALKSAVSSIDIVGILAREIAKTNIDTQVTKQAISAIHALEPKFRSGAVAALLDPSNLETLAPVFTNVMKTLRSLYGDFDNPTKDSRRQSHAPASQRRFTSDSKRPEPCLPATSVRAAPQPSQRNAFDGPLYAVTLAPCAKGNHPHHGEVGSHLLA